MPVFTTPKKEGDITGKVLGLRQQGFSNDQIIAALQKEGVAVDQIFEAIHLADLKGTITPTAAPSGQLPPAHPMTLPSQQIHPPSDIPKEKIEEVAEAIIDEKWNTLVDSINKIIDWKEKIESDMQQIDARIDSLKENVETIQKSISGKLGEYDKNMSDVGTDVKALTKVFQKILPGFVENVNELSRITQNIKSGTPKTTTKKAVKKDKSDIFEDGEKSEESKDDESIENIF